MLAGPNLSHHKGQIHAGSPVRGHRRGQIHADYPIHEHLFIFGVREGVRREREERGGRRWCGHERAEGAEGGDEEAQREDVREGVREGEDMAMEARVGDGHGMHGDKASEERLERDRGGQTVEESWRKSQSVMVGEAALRWRSASRVAAEGEGRWEASGGDSGREAFSVGIFFFLLFLFGIRSVGINVWRRIVRQFCHACTRSL
jgi:hypothetical protein